MAQTPQSNSVNREKCADIATKIVALRALTKRTGHQTSRSQGQLLQSLGVDELVLVSEMLTALEGE